MGTASIKWFCKKEERYIIDVPATGAHSPSLDIKDKNKQTREYIYHNNLTLFK